jgi:hypothetical protein
MHDTSGSKQLRPSLGDKPRGANRSTKIAGKLKVLPEQPEPLLKKSSPKRFEDASTGESEDRDIESSEGNEQDESDFEACVTFSASNWMLTLNDMLSSQPGI